MGADAAVTERAQQPGGGSRTVRATVIEERPAAVYVVVLENQHQALAHVGGVGQRNFVRLTPGDRVEVELAPHDPTRGRIVRKVAGADRDPQTRAASGPERQI